MKNTLFQAEMTIGVVDGKQEELLSPCGVLMMIYLAWKDKPNPKTDRAIEMYCRHLALHGYGVGARVILSELKSKDEVEALQWIKDTFSQYALDGGTLIQSIIE